MLGVDFVINALFETSGLRPGGDWARVMLKERIHETKAMKKNSGSLTARSVLECGQWESAKRVRLSRSLPIQPAAAVAGVGVLPF
jgi:hypothetical protein